MQNAKLRCCVQTTDRKGLSFSDFLDQCSLQVVTTKFEMSDKLVRSILKAKMYKFKEIPKKKENDFFQFSPSSLLIILYKLTKFETPSCNGF